MEQGHQSDGQLADGERGALMESGRYLRKCTRRAVRNILMTLLAWGPSSSIWAVWEVSQLDSLKEAFLTASASNYESREYPWRFFDTAGCLEQGGTCWGSNPDSPYGYPDFTGGTGGYNSTWLGQSEAFVLILETPPETRYFGITPYLMTRYYDQLPQHPSNSGYVGVFESLTDTLNNLRIKTLGSTTPGENVYSQLSVVIYTADQLTQWQLTRAFASIDFPSTAINVVALPLTAVPLNMGYSATSDTYSLALRPALATDQAALDDYVDRAPLRILKLRPIRQRRAYPLPDPVSITPGSGIVESADLQVARDQLVKDVKIRYASKFTYAENQVELRYTSNYICVEKGLVCSGDNPDAIYVNDILQYVPNSRKERILIVGINHSATGKTLYLSHSIVKSENAAGIVAVSDDQIVGSARALAGVTDLNDPRYAAYENLYAFTISYECDGDPYCVTIPEPTPDTIVGIPFGDAIDIKGRYYVDPMTKTRPLESEVYFHRVTVMTPK